MSLVAPQVSDGARNAASLQLVSQDVAEDRRLLGCDGALAVDGAEKSCCGDVWPYDLTWGCVHPAAVGRVRVGVLDSCLVSEPHPFERMFQRAQGSHCVFGDQEEVFGCCAVGVVLILEQVRWNGQSHSLQRTSDLRPQADVNRPPQPPGSGCLYEKALELADTARAQASVGNGTPVVEWH